MYEDSIALARIECGSPRKALRQCAYVMAQILRATRTRNRTDGRTDGKVWCNASKNAVIYFYRNRYGDTR